MKQALRESAQTWGCEAEEMSGATWILPELRLAAQGGSPFHALVLDLDVADLDASIGIQIAADPLVFDTALIAIASNSGPAADARLREKGFQACLAKPMEALELHRTLADIWTQKDESEPAEPCFAGSRQVRRRLRVASQRATPGGAGRFEQSHSSISPGVARGRQPGQSEARVALARKGGPQGGCSGNGSQAVAATGKTAYDLILMDCQMPEMDGFEATAEIRPMEGGARHTTICRADRARHGRRPRALSRRGHGRLHQQAAHDRRAAQEDRPLDRQRIACPNCLNESSRADPRSAASPPAGLFNAPKYGG